CSCASTAPTTSPTARTCATSPRAPRSRARWGSARARCRWKTSNRPTASWCSARTRAPTTHACSASCATRPAAAAGPRRSTRIATDYFQLRIGGDLAAVKGMAKHVLERDAEAVARGAPSLLDRDFIDAHTTGFEAFAADVAAERWETIVAESGLDEAAIRRAGDLYLASGRVIACWGMGITQHRHSVATIHMIANLMLLRGN